MKNILLILVCGHLFGCAAMTADRQEMMNYKTSENSSWFSNLFLNPCALGGMDVESNIHCGAQNFGSEGQMVALNTTAKRNAGPNANCEQHVATAEALASAQGFEVNRLYSCPDEFLASKGECHVSLLVTEANGTKWVLDNGAVIDKNLGIAATAKWSEVASTYSEFPSGVGQEGLAIVTNHVLALRSK